MAAHIGRDFRINLPTVSVRDIRIAPQFDDLVVATHGRDIWILDDTARSSNSATRSARASCSSRRDPPYEYHYHSNETSASTRDLPARIRRTARSSTSIRALRKRLPASLQILDASGNVIRTVKGTHKVKDKEVPFISNKAGINRFVWDFHEDGRRSWMGRRGGVSRAERRGRSSCRESTRVRLTLGGKTLSQARRQARSARLVDAGAVPSRLRFRQEVRDAPTERSTKRSTTSMRSRSRSRRRRHGR